MDMPTFNFPDNELKSYYRHGIAHVRISQMIPIPQSGCCLNLEPLLEIEQPRYCWVKETPEAPQVTIASSKAKGIPEFVTFFDPDKRLGSLIVRYWYNHPKKDYTDVKLEPVYRG